MDWWQIFLIILFSVIIGLGVGYIAGYLIITRILKKPFAVFTGKAREVVTVTEEPQKSITTSGLFSRLTRIREKISPQAEEPVKITARDIREAREIEEQERKEAIVTEEVPKPVMPDVLAELTEEKERKRAEKEARELAKRQAEEARKASLIQERERKRAEQEARELAKREAEKVKEVSSIEEPEREKAAVGEERLQVAAPNLFTEVENNRIIANEPWTGKLLPFQTNGWNANPAELHTLPADLREQLAQAYSDIQLANSIVWLATELERRSPNLDENYKKLCTNIAARLEVIIPLLKQLEKK